MELLGLIIGYPVICYAIIICLLHVFDWSESEVDDLLFSWIMFLILPFIFLFVATRFYLGKIISKTKR
nr:MAG TPA: hypothetical protein [Caudoviricetes sp.]